MFKYSLVVVLSVQEKILIEQIINTFKESKYVVKNQNDNSIHFIDDLWQLRWNWEALNRIEEGNLTFKTDENSTFIQLKYYLSYQLELLISVIALALGLFIFNDYWVIILPIIFWVQFLYRIKKSKEASQDLLNKIQS